MNQTTPSQSTPDNAPSPRKKAAFRVPRIVSMALACSLAFGLLIWLKLRMVSEVPRSAYADPDARAFDPRPSTTPAPAEVAATTDQAPDDEPVPAIAPLH